MPFLLKRVLFRLHWIVGLVGGLVLAVVGVTGALLSYESEIVAALNPQLTLEARGREALGFDALVARAMVTNPGFSVRSVAAHAQRPQQAVELRLARGAERGGLALWLDPYTGDALAEPRGVAFFHTVEELHRFLAAGPAGKQIVGASTVGLLLLAISGVVLRWPRRWRSPRAWLALDTKLRGRNLLWHLHAVAGTWLLAFYVLAAATGLWWSYEFYRNAVNALAGVPAQQRPPPPPPGAASGSVPPPVPPVSIDAAHAAFLRAAPGALRYSVGTGSDAAAPIEWRYLTTASPHERAFDSLKLAADGSVVARQPYAELPRGRRLVASMLPLHTGSWFGAAGRAVMALASFAMPLFAITGWWLWLQRRRRARLARDVAGTASVPCDAAGGGAVDVLHASQSGTAEKLAWRTAAWLREIGLAPRVRPLSQWQPTPDGAPALFVVATYGEGQPPDAALPFARRWLREAAPDLSTLDCGVLALGNRRYADFCGFGRTLSHWLAHGGARLWFDRVDTHEGDEAALRDWHAGLARRWPALATQRPDTVSGVAPEFARWTLQRSRRLNPASPAAALHDVELQPPTGASPAWQPGDLLEVRVDAQAPRRYSIASRPMDGHVRLLVRRLVGADGRTGIASSALCGGLPEGASIDARIVPSHGFAPPPHDVPVLLVANGVGIAPFLPLLAARRAVGAAPAWLLYGERDPAHDAALLPELQGYVADRTMARFDLAWSRAATPAYVQQVLEEAAADVAAWLARGAELLVCGSPEMGAGVEQVLLARLGDDAVDALRDAGRYRRELF